MLWINNSTFTFETSIQKISRIKLNAHFSCREFKFSSALWIVQHRSQCKIFLTATPEERARRRFAELSARGEHLTFEDVLRMQNARDLRDKTREVGRLERAADAIEFFTDALTTEEVVDQLESLVRRKMHDARAAMAASP